jgi:hypothetical protein
MTPASFYCCLDFDSHIACGCAAPSVIVFATVSPASLANSSPSFMISHAQMGALIDQVQMQHLAALQAKGLLCDAVLLPASSAG